MLPTFHSLEPPARPGADHHQQQQPAVSRPTLRVRPARVHPHAPPGRGAMAWRSHGYDQPSLVAALQKHGVIRSAQVADALRSTDRALFLAPGTDSSEAYRDNPVPIGYGQTLSAPHMHAECLEQMEPWLAPGASALDVGSGSGYLVAALSRLVGPAGRVTGIELVAPLAERSQAALQKDSAAGEGLRSGRIGVFAADAFKGDWPDDAAPYDAIHVGAAAARVPEALWERLKPGGVMVVPLGVSGPLSSQVLTRITKDADGNAHKHAITGVVYVPLVEEKN